MLFLVSFSKRDGTRVPTLRRLHGSCLVRQCSPALRGLTPKGVPVSRMLLGVGSHFFAAWPQRGKE